LDDRVRKSLYCFGMAFESLKSACGEYDGECLLYHSLSSAMFSIIHLAWQFAFCFGVGAREPQQRGITKRDDRAYAIAILYQTCKTWRTQLSKEGFCMRTFSLCRGLADGNGAQTLQRVQATIARQIGRLPDQDERAWWLHARSLMQRCDFRDGSGTVWSWLQAASQEPDGPLSKEADATAKMLGQHLVCWPDKPRARFPGLCTLTGHSREVTSVAYSPDGKHVVSGSWDKTVKIWDAQSGKEVRVVV
jgi:hypothetical protein